MNVKDKLNSVIQVLQDEIEYTNKCCKLLTHESWKWKRSLLDDITTRIETDTGIKLMERK